MSFGGLLLLDLGYPLPGHPFGVHGGCRGLLLWRYVPPQHAVPRGPGILRCRSCRAEGWGFTERAESIAAAEDARHRLDVFGSADPSDLDDEATA